MLIIVAVAVLLDEVVGNTGAIRNLVIYFFVANEGISILENWGAMGLPLPKKVFEVLEQIKTEKSRNIIKETKSLNILRKTGFLPVFLFYFIIYYIFICSDHFFTIT